MKPGYLAMIQTKYQWCSPGILTRGALQQGQIFGIMPGGEGELVLPDRKGVSEVVPEGGTFDQSLINISFPKIVGERSIFHYHFSLLLLLFNLRHSNIFKISPTKLYGYTRWDIDSGCHHHNTHTHQGSFVPVIQKCPELAGGVYQYDIWEILNFVGFFLIIVGQTLKIMLIKNNCC
jgi:hypothetical protein